MVLLPRAHLGDGGLVDALDELEGSGVADDVATDGDRLGQ